MQRTLIEHWQSRGILGGDVYNDSEYDSLWRQLRDFPSDSEAALTMKANLRPSQVAAFCALVLTHAPAVEILADGSGQVFVKCAELPPEVNHLMLRHLQPFVARSGGHIGVLHIAEPPGWTEQMLWGRREPADELARRIKEQFDPHGILNPGRLRY
jgi:hypothetical protein